VWKVADFGIAKSTEAAVDLTATGGLIGTPAYLAPERVDGRPAAPASDLYSAGVVLYEAVSGRKPFEADTPLAVAQMVRDRPPVPLRSLCPDLDPALVDTIERAMGKDPTRRFSSAAEMSRALAGDAESTLPRSHGSAPVATGGTRVLPAPPRPRRRVNAGWLVAAAAVGVIGVAVGVAALRDSDSPSPVPEETIPTTRAVEDADGSGPPLPASLDDALEQLEQSVQP
jgi:eukaryotic-like serine/threonine-protein kinase